MRLTPWLQKPSARIFVLATVVLGLPLVINLELLSFRSRTRIDHVWSNNEFSSATSGLLFQMRVWRRFHGNRIVVSTHDTVDVLPTLSSLNCSAWAVVTTISSPTTTVRQLAKLAEDGKLCLVVVGDRRTPVDYQLGNNSVYLSPAQQEQLPYTIIKHLPWNHFGRKNVGFMYAIHHGANYVYDTDDDNELVGGIPRLEQKQFSTLHANHHVVNPYPCFSSEETDSRTYAFSWPRGFPLESIKDARTVSCAAHNATQNEFESVAVIQSLANHDPDVDAVYRLTRPLPISFRSLSNDKEAVILPMGAFTPYNAQATLYERRAMWGLLLPITVHGRVSDIWRSYFTQRIMWSAGLTLAMARPWVIQKRNAHNYLGDLQAEQNLYYQAGRLVEYLSLKFDSATSTTISSPIESLYVSMYEYGVVDIGDVKLAQAWLSDLYSIGYKFPKVVGNFEKTSVDAQIARDGAKLENPMSKSAIVFKRPKLK